MKVAAGGRQLFFCFNANSWDTLECPTINKREQEQRRVITWHPKNTFNTFVDYKENATSSAAEARKNGPDIIISRFEENNSRPTTKKNSSDTKEKHIAEKNRNTTDNDKKTNKTFLSVSQPPTSRRRTIRGAAKKVYWYCT